MHKMSRRLKLLVLVHKISLILILSASADENFYEYQPSSCAVKVLSICKCGQNGTLKEVYVESCPETTDGIYNYECVPCPNACLKFSNCLSCSMNQCSTCPSNRSGSFCELNNFSNLPNPSHESNGLNTPKRKKPFNSTHNETIPVFDFSNLNKSMLKQNEIQSSMPSSNEEVEAMEGFRHAFADYFSNLPNVENWFRSNSNVTFVDFLNLTRSDYDTYEDPALASDIFEILLLNRSGLKEPTNIQPLQQSMDLEQNDKKLNSIEDMLLLSNPKSEEIPYVYTLQKFFNSDYKDQEFDRINEQPALVIEPQKIINNIAHKEIYKDKTSGTNFSDKGLFKNISVFPTKLITNNNSSSSHNDSFLRRYKNDIPIEININDKSENSKEINIKQKNINEATAERKGIKRHTDESYSNSLSSDLPNELKREYKSSLLKKHDLTQNDFLMPNEYYRSNLPMQQQKTEAKSSPNSIVMTKDFNPKMNESNKALQNDSQLKLLTTEKLLKSSGAGNDSKYFDKTFNFDHFKASQTLHTPQRSQYNNIQSNVPFLPHLHSVDQTYCDMNPFDPACLSIFNQQTYSYGPNFHGHSHIQPLPGSGIHLRSFDQISDERSHNPQKAFSSFTQPTVQPQLHFHPPSDYDFPINQPSYAFQRNQPISFGSALTQFSNLAFISPFVNPYLNINYGNDGFHDRYDISVIGGHYEPVLIPNHRRSEISSFNNANLGDFKTSFKSEETQGKNKEKKRSKNLNNDHKSRKTKGLVSLRFNKKTGNLDDLSQFGFLSVHIGVPKVKKAKYQPLKVRQNNEDKSNFQDNDSKMIRSMKNILIYEGRNYSMAEKNGSKTGFDDNYTTAEHHIPNIPQYLREDEPLFSELFFLKLLPNQTHSKVLSSRNMILEYKNETDSELEDNEPEVLNFSKPKSGYTPPLRRRRRESDDNWCPIIRQHLHGNLECLMWTYKKVCWLQCHSGFMTNETSFVCFQDIGQWMPSISPCFGFEGNATESSLQKMNEQPSQNSSFVDPGLHIEQEMMEKGNRIENTDDQYEIVYYDDYGKS